MVFCYLWIVIAKSTIILTETSRMFILLILLKIFSKLQRFNTFFVEAGFMPASSWATTRVAPT
jgi:hypothetical protein